MGPLLKNSWASENSPSEDPHKLVPGRGPRVSSPESPLRWRFVSSAGEGGGEVGRGRGEITVKIVICSKLYS